MLQVSAERAIALEEADDRTATALLRGKPFAVDAFGNTIQYNTIQYNTIQYKYNTIQIQIQIKIKIKIKIEIQYNTNTIHYNTIQYTTIVVEDN